MSLRLAFFLASRGGAIWRVHPISRTSTSNDPRSPAPWMLETSTSNDMDKPISQKYHGPVASRASRQDIRVDSLGTIMGPKFTTCHQDFLYENCHFEGI